MSRPRGRCELGDREHLVAGDETEVHRRSDRAQSRVVLSLDAHVVCRVVVERLEREVGERVAEPSLDLLAHPFRPAVVHHELHAGLDPGEAVAQVFLPGVEQCPHDRHGLVLADPDTEVARDPRHRREPASHENSEAALAVAEHADERDAVDLRRVAAMDAGGDRDLVLARQVRVVGIAVEELCHLVVQRRDVEELVVGEPGDRAAGEVPDGVAAGADRRQARFAEPLEHRRQRSELEVVELHRLSRRQLAGAAAVLVRELADRAQLRGCDPSRRQLDAKHERSDLGLVVVGAPPLEPDEILLLDVRVAGGDESGELAEHREWALLTLEPLDGVPLEDELERRRLLQRPGSLCHAVPPSAPERRGAPIPEPRSVPAAPAPRHLPARRPGWATRGWSSHLSDGSPGCGGFVGPGPSTAHDG